MSPHEHHSPEGATICAQVRELLAEAVDAPLPPPQRAQVEAHLAGCAPCRAVASWMDAADAAAAKSPTPPPPTGAWLSRLRARVMDQVRSESTAAAPAHGELDQRVERAGRPGREPGLRGLWPAWPEFLRSPRVLATLAAVALIGIFTYAEVRDRAELSRAPEHPPQLVSDPRDASVPKLTTLPDDAASQRANGLEQAPPALGRLAAGEPAASPPATTAPQEGDRHDLVQELRSETGSGQRLQVLAKEESPFDPARFGQRALGTVGAAVAETVRAAAGISQSAAPAQPQADLNATTTDQDALMRVASREAEVEVGAADSSTAPRWDADQTRGALALVLRAQEPRDVEAAVGELMLALEASPQPSRGFARAAKRVQIAPAASQRPPATGMSSTAQPLRDASGLASKDQARTMAPALAPSAPPSPFEPQRWSELPAAAAASSLTDSATVALLARLPLLPEGQVRERALQWLRLRGLR